MALMQAILLPRGPRPRPKQPAALLLGELRGDQREPLGQHRVHVHAVNPPAPLDPSQRPVKVVRRGTLMECIARLPDLGLPAHLTYQPGSRFWPLQLIATGFFLAPSACARGPASGDSTTLS
jgi:hypothetical protein